MEVQLINEELPNMDAGGPGREFQETFRTELCPAKGQYVVQIPKGTWHTIEVKEESTILRVKMASMCREEGNVSLE